MTATTTNDRTSIKMNRNDFEEEDDFKRKFGKNKIKYCFYV